VLTWIFGVAYTRLCKFLDLHPNEIGLFSKIILNMRGTKAQRRGSSSKSMTEFLSSLSSLSCFNGLYFSGRSVWALPKKLN